MADDDRRTDIDKLLAEVEGSLSGKPAPPVQPVQPAGPPARRRGRVRGRLRTAAVSGAVAGGFVWVLFAVLPFLHATSGAAGAFLATFAAVALLPRR